MNRSIENKRVEIQKKLDSQKTQDERNRLGQFATPTELARDILSYAKTLLPKQSKIKFLDPAVGTGSFFSALIATFPESEIESAEGFEIDPYYGDPSKEIWRGASLNIKLSDFTNEIPPEKNNQFNLVICNPPYVRHHHISAEDKQRLVKFCEERIGISINGLAGLYCYFLLLSHNWMEKNGFAGWLIPSEFMDVNYGKALKEYLLDKVKLLRIHRFDPDNVQFEDALVSSTVVWFKKVKPPKSYHIEFSFGGTLNEPAISRMISADILRSEPKWTRFPVLDARELSRGVRLADLFTIKRGIATGNNKFFILSRDQIEKYQIPFRFLRPVLPSPRYLKINEIKADDEGNPLTEKPLYLLDCKLPEDEIRGDYPELWDYLQVGLRNEVHIKYLCRNRTPWYSQEKRESAPILCTYMGRDKQKGGGKPFRFILNHSNATATNVYLLLYPKPLLYRAFNNNPELIRIIWNALNNISTDDLIEEGRVYGGGLHKLEPKELSNVSAPDIVQLIPNLRPNPRSQGGLFQG